MRKKQFLLALELESLNSPFLVGTLLILWRSHGVGGNGGAVLREALQLDLLLQVLQILRLKFGPDTDEGILQARGQGGDLKESRGLVERPEAAQE